MDKKKNYETPVFKEVEFDFKSVLCTSERDGDIASLDEKYDWSDMWN